MKNVAALKLEVIKCSGSRLRHKAYLSTCLHLVLIILSSYNIKMMKYKLEIHTKAYSYFSSRVLSRYSFFTFFCTQCSLRVIYFKTTMISRDIWPRQITASCGCKLKKTNVPLYRTWFYHVHSPVLPLCFRYWKMEGSTFWTLPMRTVETGWCLSGSPGTKKNRPLWLISTVEKSTSQQLR